MNEEERYLLDLQGYLVIENAIEATALARMNAWLDEQEKQDSRWSGQTGNDHLDHLLTWGPDFRALIDNPRVLPVLKGALGDDLRLDHDYAIFLRPGGKGLFLHGGATPHDRTQYYQVIDGKMYNGLVVATYALTDVPEGQGGLVCVPGSHKSNFVCPPALSEVLAPSPVMRQIACKAGDCVVFTEALLHGTLPWQGPHVRRTLFFKYSPGHMMWVNRPYYPLEGQSEMAGLGAELTEVQRLLLNPPYVHDRPRVP